MTDHNKEQDSYAKIEAEMRKYMSSSWRDGVAMSKFANRLAALNRAQGWPPCKGVPSSKGCKYLALCYAPCNKCGQQHDGMPLPAAPNKEKGQ